MHATLTLESARRHAARLGVVLAGALAFALLAPDMARSAAPPVNDNRNSAILIKDIPSAIRGTTLGATVERLDPQVSPCGRIEGSVWYRLRQAPDGTLGFSVQGAGLSPVVRVYHPTKQELEDVDCSAAGQGQPAAVTFVPRRGDTYLVMVGRRPGTPAEPFAISTKLFLPPANDGIREAKRLGPLPLDVAGTTIAATSEDTDPTGCGLAGNTVWYSLTPSAGQRILLRMHAAGSFDAAVVVLQKVRSQITEVACGQTNATGDLVVAWDTAKRSSYLIAVGTREGATPGDFTLKANAPPTREKAPGLALSTGQVRATVNWLSDPNDFFWTTFSAGTTYRIAFTSSCAHLTVMGPYAELKSIGCNGFTTFTPGPDGAGRYVFEVTAPHHEGTIAYHLVVLKAGMDDMGLGRLAQNLHTVHGALTPSSGDVVDLYHFNVTGETAQDTRLRLGTKPHAGIELELYDDTGYEIASSGQQIRENLDPGRYVFAVRSHFTQPGGRYEVWLVIRSLTKTTLTLPKAEVPLGTTLSPTISITPAPDMGGVTYQVDRLDPLEGWVFSRMVTTQVGKPIYWAPPAQGNWRIRARYLGSLKFSPSVSEYAHLSVTAPNV
jgi:hypothetical protein